MNGTLRDPCVWLPALLGIAAFLPAALPRPAAAPGPRPTAIALPALHGLPPGSTRLRFEVDHDDSQAHFLVRGPRGELLTRCPALRGELELDGKAGTGHLELQLDLSAIPTDDGDRGLGVHHVLGAHRTTVITYQGDLVATTRTDLPGVQLLTFVGRLVFGERVLQQPMQLWTCQLPGKPLRLQGHGTVAASSFGLPARRLLGVFAENHEVTLGLDLAWRRRRD